MSPSGAARVSLRLGVAVTCVATGEPAAETSWKQRCGYGQGVATSAVGLEVSLVRDHLERIVQSPTFVRSPQAARFLRFVVEEALEGRADTLKAYAIGVHALGATSDRSDPDNVARMQASRVRKLLQSYYRGPGRADRLCIQLPVGSYAPRFDVDSQAPNRTRAPLLAIEGYVDHSRSERGQWLAAALTEELAATLVRFEGLRITTAERSPLIEPPDFALGGSVWVAGGQARIRSTLRETSSNERVWSDRRELSLGADEFSLLDETAWAIGARVGDPALGCLTRALKRGGSGDDCSHAIQHAYEFHQTFAPEDYETARHALECLLQLEPQFTLGHAALADLLATAYSLDPVGEGNALAEAEQHARVAVAQDPQCQHARFAKGFVHFHRRESEPARQELKLAIELNPAAALVVARAGGLLALAGDWEVGLTWVERAFRRVPELPSFYQLARCVYHFAYEGNPDQALLYAERIDTHRLLWDPLLRAVCLASLGRTYEAREAAQRLVRRSPGFLSHKREYLAGYLYDGNTVNAFLSSLPRTGIGSRLSPQSERRGARHPAAASSLRSPTAEIRVGILHSLTGTMAICEQPLVNAALLAIDEVNAAGGVLGRHVRAIVEDGASEPARFAQHAEALLRDGSAITLFGCWTSSSRKAVKPVVESHDRLLWYPVQYEGLERSEHIIYTGSCSNQQIAPAVQWALETGRRRCFLVGSDYVFPHTANQLIRALVETAGGEVLGEEYRPLGSGRFALVATRIRDCHPDIVFNTVNGSDNVALFREFSKLALRADECPVMSFSLSELELSSLRGVACGHYACWSYFQSLDAPENADLVRRFRRRYGEQGVLSDPVVTAYAQVHLWRRVVEKARSLATDAILANVVGSQLKLGADSLEVGENHHVMRPALVGRIRADDQFDIVWKSSKPIAPRPWLGIEESHLDARALILQALGSLPDAWDYATEGNLNPPLGTATGVSPHERGIGDVRTQ